MTPPRSRTPTATTAGATPLEGAAGRWTTRGERGMRGRRRAARLSGMYIMYRTLASPCALLPPLVSPLLSP